MEIKAVVGLTGPFGSGKSTAATFFAQKGYRVVTLSSFLEEEAKKRGNVKATRTLLQDIGDEWRKEFGAGVLAQRAVTFFKEQGITKGVVDGIRNQGEIEELRKLDTFVLLGITANPEIRFERVKDSKRGVLTYETFTQADKRDRGEGEDSIVGLQVEKCLNMADVIIENNTTEEAFIEILSKKLEERNLL